MRVRPTIAQLGHLVRTYREQRGVTQEEFVKELSIPTNRSAIAHLEQGIRLPSPSILRAICSNLHIPEALWHSFESNQLRRRLNKMPHTLSPEYAPRTIAVSGIMGSGKTTLARNIASQFGMRYVGENPQGIAYLSDLDVDPRRWAFETQLAFLSDKSLEILQAMDRYPTIVVDRWISEDIEVFAYYFYSKGYIDSRAYDVYKKLADHFMEMVSTPDMIIVCEVDVELAIDRIRTRTRSDMFLHTPKHLMEISQRYDEWISRQNDTRIYKIDSSRWDWRTENHLLQIYRELEEQFFDFRNNEHQFDLFFRPDSASTSKGEPMQTEKALELIQDYNWTARYATFPGIVDLGPLPYPCAYIAAPFTGIATETAANLGDLFEDTGPHGTIPPGRYRSALLSIERALRKLGIHSLLPHRDVNEWGARKLSSEQVVSLCTTQVTRCDFFVGLLGTSHGSHYEFGLARARDIPSIIIHCDELSESFIADGVKSDGTRTFVINVTRLRDIEGVLMSVKTSEFIKQHM